MANVGTGTAGKVLTATGVTSSSAFKAIGTDSGLTQFGVVISEGAGAFQATTAGSTGQILTAVSGANPVWAAPSSTLSLNIDSFTAPGTDPVVPSGAGVITITGAQVASGTVGANVIRTDSSSANTYAIQIQRTTNNISTDSTKNGVSHFDSTQFYVDTNGFVQPVINFTSVGVQNLGITATASTFTVCSANGTALSSTNQGFVTLQDKNNPGLLKSYAITANQTFTYGTGGSISNNRFGFTVDIDYAQDFPFWLYAVSNDAENAINFMVARVPHANVSPASASIGKSGSVVNVGQGDFFALGNPTVTDYDGNPCMNIGSFRMRKSGTTNNYWDVQSLSTTDGINNFQEGIQFQVPTGAFGNVSGKYFNSTAGTEPSSATQEMSFWLTRTGLISLNFVLWNISTAGTSGLVSLQQRIPYKFYNNTSDVWAGPAFCYELGAGPTAPTAGNLQCNTNSNVVAFLRTGGTDAMLQNQAALTGAFKYAIQYQTPLS
jgi:hypothetical protein